MKLFRSFATVGGFTLVSRVLGFVRDIMIAAVLGTGAVADAFFVAFRFPNLFRRLFAEGAFNAAFIPLFARRLEGEGAEEARLFAEQAMAVLVMALIVLTAVAEIFMPWLMYLLAGGFADTPDKFNLAVAMTRITFPYLLFVSLLALFSGILNSFHRFAAAAAAPVVLNIVFIAVLGALSWLGLGNSARAGIILSWAISFAGLLQLLVVIFAARKVGMVLGLKLPRLTPGVRRLFQLGIPGAIAGGITQINIAIGTVIASMQDQAVAWLYYADRLYQLPLGVVGIAIGVVLLPDIARLLRAGEEGDALQAQNRSLEFALLLTLPAAVALVIIPEPILQILFQRGAFNADDTQAVSRALFAFAWGLPAFVMIKVFSPGYFAREDTKTPMRYAGYSMIVNVAISLALFPFLGHVGIAIATSVSGWLNALLLGSTLFARGYFKLDAGVKKRLPRILLASGIMGAALYFSTAPLAPWLTLSASLWQNVAALGLLVGSGLAVYGLAVILTGGVERAHLAAAFRRRRSK